MDITRARPSMPFMKLWKWTEPSAWQASWPASMTRWRSSLQTTLICSTLVATPCGETQYLVCATADPPPSIPHPPIYYLFFKNRFSECKCVSFHCTLCLQSQVWPQRWVMLTRNHLPPSCTGMGQVTKLLTAPGKTFPPLTSVSEMGLGSVERKRFRLKIKLSQHHSCFIFLLKYCHKKSNFKRRITFFHARTNRALLL